MACKRMVVDDLDHFLRARHVCGYWSIVSSFAAKGACVSGSLETFQASAVALVVLLHRRVRPLALLSGAYFSDLDLLSSFQSTNISHRKPMVHFSNVVFAGICMGVGTSPFHICTHTSVEIPYSGRWHCCSSGIRNLEYRHHRIQLGSRRHSVVLHLYRCGNGVARTWSTIIANPALCGNCLSCSCVRVVAIPATTRWRRQ